MKLFILQTFPPVLITAHAVRNVVQVTSLYSVPVLPRISVRGGRYENCSIDLTEGRKGKKERKEIKSFVIRSGLQQSSM
jgi:hypothetical protein